MNTSPPPESSVLLSFDTATGAAVARVTVARERRLNALSSGVLAELTAMFASLSQQDELRVVVLTGAGDRAFVGGADIDEMGALQDGADARAFISRVHAACEAVRTCPVPVIARIQGYALGAGLELAASCDIRIAADTAVFGMPEVKLGMPSVVEAALLPRLVGWGRAREMLLLGETFSARHAESWGLAERVVPRDELDDAVDACVQQVLSARPRAVRLQKRLIREWESLSLADAIGRGIDTFADAFETDEPGLAIREYRREKR